MNFSQDEINLLSTGVMFALLAYNVVLSLRGSRLSARVSELEDARNIPVSAASSVSMRSRVGAVVKRADGSIDDLTGQGRR